MALEGTEISMTIICSRMFRRVINRMLRLRLYKLTVIFLSIICVVMLLNTMLFMRHKGPKTGEIREEDSVGYRPKIRFVSLVIEDKPHTITRIIHQTWKTSSVPTVFKAWVKSWIDMNPEYEYWFWTDDDVRNLVEENYPDYLDLFDSYPSPIYRADAFRYFVMYEHGGVYADIDTSCLRPIDYQMAEHDCILTQEPLEHAYLLPEWLIERPLVSNAIIACKPRHPFFEKMIRRLPLTTGSWFRWNDVLKATGPMFLREGWMRWNKHPDRHKDELFLAEPEVYQPSVDDVAIPHMRKTCTDLPLKDEVKSDFTKTQRMLCERLLNPYFRNEPGMKSFTIHHWAGTWDNVHRTLKKNNESFSVLSLKLN